MSTTPKMWLVAKLRPAQDDIKPSRQEADIQALMHSIKCQGFLGALTVFLLADGYAEVVDGTTRLLALQRLGVLEVAVTVLAEKPDASTLRLWRLRPNLIHAQMTIEDQATNYLALMREQGWSQKQLAQHLGGKQFEPKISKALKIFRSLAELLKAELNAGRMAEKAAYHLCDLSAERQVAFWEINKGKTVEEIEDLVAAEKELAGKPAKAKPVSVEVDGVKAVVSSIEGAAAGLKRILGALKVMAERNSPLADLPVFVRMQP